MSTKKIPRYVVICIRIGTRPVDWYEMERCVQQRYQEILEDEDEGPAGAEKFARVEALWFLVEGFKRLLRSLLPF